MPYLIGRGFFSDNKSRSYQTIKSQERFLRIKSGEIDETQTLRPTSRELFQVEELFFCSLHYQTSDFNLTSECQIQSYESGISCDAGKTFGSSNHHQRNS